MRGPSPRREQRILEMARRETDPRHTSDFEPITKGPIVAVLAMVGLGIVAVFYAIYRRIASLVRQQ